MTDQSTVGLFLAGTGELMRYECSISLTTDRYSLATRCKPRAERWPSSHSRLAPDRHRRRCGNLQLTAANFSTNFANGFADIIIGGSSTGNIIANALTFSDNLTLWRAMPMPQPPCREPSLTQEQELPRVA